MNISYYYIITGSSLPYVLILRTFFMLSIFSVLPHPPRSLIAKAVLSTAIEVHWAAGFNGFSSILSYDLEMLRQGTVQWKAIQPSIPGHIENYTVNGLVPFTLYGFRMRTQTEVGKSVYSVIVNARTFEDGKISPRL